MNELGWNTGGMIQRLRAKPVTVPLCSPTIPSELAWNWTQTFTMRDWWLTTWAKAWPLKKEKHSNYEHWLYSYNHRENIWDTNLNDNYKEYCKICTSFKKSWLLYIWATVCSEFYNAALAIWFTGGSRTLIGEVSFIHTTDMCTKCQNLLWNTCPLVTFTVKILIDIRLCFLFCHYIHIRIPPSLG